MLVLQDEKDMLHLQRYFFNYSLGLCIIRVGFAAP